MTLQYPHDHAALMMNIDSPNTLIHGITYIFNNLIEFKPNFYNIKNSTTNNMIKHFFKIICL